MDKKLRICITATSIHDISVLYLKIFKAREEEMVIKDRSNLEFELDDCEISMIIPMSNEIYNKMFDQIIFVKEEDVPEVEEWVNRYLKTRISMDKLFHDDKRLLTLGKLDKFWENPRFPR